MSDSLRAPLVVIELITLAVILAVVSDPIPRVAFGLVVGLLLAYSALKPARPYDEEGAPEGYDDRRHDHLYRHWVNVLLKKIREFHTVAEGVNSGGMNSAIGQMRLSDVERDIQDLLSQVTESAKPTNMRKGRRAASAIRAKSVETVGGTSAPV
jgi:hypothetical protein